MLFIKLRTPENNFYFFHILPIKMCIERVWLPGETSYEVDLTAFFSCWFFEPLPPSFTTAGRRGLTFYSASQAPDWRCPRNR